MSSPSIQPILLLVRGAAEANPTQYMIEKAFAHNVLDWRYLTVEVAADRLADALTGIKAMGFCGGHFSDDLKQAVVPLLESTSDVAAAVGVANAFSRSDNGLRGENFEGLGALAAMRPKIDPAGQRVVLFGAGKAACAIGFELAAAGVAEIRILNRSEEKAHALAEMLVGRFSSTLVSAAGWQGDYTIPPETNIIVHATSAVRENPDAELPLDAASLHKQLLVVDLSIDPPQTRLIQQARENGCATVDGLEIFIEQRIVALRQWTGGEFDRHTMREAAEEFLEV